jgi:O-antigen ligase
LKVKAPTRSSRLDVDFEWEIQEFQVTFWLFVNTGHMRITKRPIISSESLLRGIVYVLLGSTTLIITVDSYDSAILKNPLLVVCAGTLVAIFIAQSLRKGKLLFRRTSADVPVLLFFILIIASSFYSKYQWNSQQALWPWISFIICFFAGTQLFARRTDTSTLLRVLSTIAVVVCGVAMVQFFFADKLFVDFFIGEDRRVTSTLTNATYLSGYIVLLFPTLLAFMLAETAQTWKRWLHIALLCGLSLTLAATSTRSSIVAFVVSLVSFGILSRQTKRGAFMWGAAVILTAVAGVLLVPRLAGRIETAFKNDPTSSFARRTYFWKAGYDAFKAAPFFGHGIGSYEEVMLEHRSPEYWLAKSEDIVPHAHNELIETAVDLGGAGVAVYLAVLITVLAASWRNNPIEKKRDRQLRIGIICSLLAILIDNLTNLSLRVAPVGATAWLLLGLLASRNPAGGIVRTIEFQSPKWSTLIPLGAWIAFLFWFGEKQLGEYQSEKHAIKAFVAVQSRDFVNGIKEYQLAVSSHPRNLMALSNLTMTLLMVGRNEDALHSVEHLQEFSPQYPKSNLMHAVALVGLKRYPEALTCVDKELQLRTHPDAYLYQAAAYKGLGDSLREIGSFERLLLADIRGRVEYEPSFVSGRVLQIVRKEEDVRTFRKLYERLSLLFPSNRYITSALTELDFRLTNSTKNSRSSRQPPLSIPGH